MRAHGQWGLLGGSSHLENPNPKLKSSKLAKLAQSSRGTFERKGILRQKNDLNSLDSVSRLASLNSTNRNRILPSEPDTETPYVAERTSQVSAAEPSTSPIEFKDIQASTDLRADHLLAEPSTLANSLFHLWVAPKTAADSLLRIYADLYPLTVSDQSQVQKAFSGASPDDVVRSAQSKGGLRGYVILLPSPSNCSCYSDEATQPRGARLSSPVYTDH